MNESYGRIRLVTGSVSVELRGQTWVERAESWLMSRHLGKGVAAVAKEQVCSETRKEPRRESLKTSTPRDCAETDDSVKGSEKQWT